MTHPTMSQLASRNLDVVLDQAFLIRNRIRGQHYDIQRRLRDPDFFRKKENKLYCGIRDKLLDRLGGKCVKCGFTDKRALQLDHINGDGYKEKNGRTLYKKLLDRKLDDVKIKYQILCANCNWIKRVENKEYAHNRKIICKSTK